MNLIAKFCYWMININLYGLAVIGLVLFFCSVIQTEVLIVERKDAWPLYFACSVLGIMWAYLHLTKRIVFINDKGSAKEGVAVETKILIA